MEGLVADRNLSLGDLIGTIKTFFEQIGITEVRFKPAYNPYTEPSMEIFGFHPELKKWTEIGNSGAQRAPSATRLYGRSCERQEHADTCLLVFLRRHFPTGDVATDGSARGRARDCVGSWLRTVCAHHVVSWELQCVVLLIRCLVCRACVVCRMSCVMWKTGRP